MARNMATGKRRVERDFQPFAFKENLRLPHDIGISGFAIVTADDDIGVQPGQSGGHGMAVNPQRVPAPSGVVQQAATFATKGRVVMIQPIIGLLGREQRGIDVLLIGGLAGDHAQPPAQITRLELVQAVDRAIKHGVVDFPGITVEINETAGKFSQHDGAGQGLKRQQAINPGILNLTQIIQLERGLLNETTGVLAATMRGGDDHPAAP